MFLNLSLPFSNSEPFHGLSVFAIWDHTEQELEGLDMLPEDKPHNYGFAMLIWLPTEGEATLQDQKVCLKQGQTTYDPRGFYIFWENKPCDVQSHCDTAVQSSSLSNVMPEERDLSHDPRHVITLRGSESTVLPICDQTRLISRLLGITEKAKWQKATRTEM